MPSGFHNWSQTAASNATADSSINWAEGQAPSSVNDSARVMMSVLAKWRDDNNGSLTTGGTSTAYTLTTNTIFTSLALLDNQTLAFTMNTTSGATPTLNVDGLGAKVIRNVTGVALPTGALLSGAVYRATYDNSAGEWLLHNQAGVIPSDSVITASILADAVTYAKIQNVSATARVLGRATSGAGDVEEIPLAGGLAISSGSLKATTVPYTIQRFTSGSGTYTTPAGCTAIRIRMVGGGAGGGGASNSSNSTAGGPSTFSGGTLTAAGGSAASAITNGSAGGSATGGNLVNAPGGMGQASNGAANGSGGQGGCSAFGGGGAGGLGNQTGGAGGTNTGGGGGGGGALGSVSSGGGGGAGGYVEHYISGPAASYTYAVGAGGAGASGTTGGAGGAGAAGVVIVEEYY